MDRNAAALRVALVVVTALAVVLASVGATSLLGTRSGGSAIEADTSGPPAEYQPDAVIAEPLPSQGEVRIDESLHADRGERKVVVVDRASRVEQEEIRPLVSAITTAGHEVRYHRQAQRLEETLAEADAYVRVDPERSLTSSEREALQAFTDRGGRVVMVAEPNRRVIEAGPIGLSIRTQRTQMVDLAAQYGIVFGNRYLYDTTRNDGNFRNVLAEPTDAGTAPDLDRVTLDTATRIQANDNATVLLRTPTSTKLSNGGAAAGYPVAVRSGNVLAVGDGTFMTEGRHTVADNERFLGYVLEFSLRGEGASPGAEQSEGPSAG